MEIEKKKHLQNELKEFFEKENKNIEKGKNFDYYLLDIKEEDIKKEDSNEEEKNEFQIEDIKIIYEEELKKKKIYMIY